MNETTTVPRLRGTPARIFISVDPVQKDDDKTGAAALVIAKAIVAAHPGCAIVGPHYHASARGRPKHKRRS